MKLKTVCKGEAFSGCIEMTGILVIAFGVRFLQTFVTHIWLVVSVPVLSEQMTDVQPRVSTEGRERTMAFFLAMRRVPRAKQVVMTAGRPARKRKELNTFCWICSTYKVCIEKRSRESCLHFTLDFTLICFMTPVFSPSGMAATARATAILK